MSHRFEIAEKLRVYEKRAHRAALLAVRTNPNIPVDKTAVELNTLKSWLEAGIDTLQKHGVDAWLSNI